MNERIKTLWEQAAETTQGDSWEEQTKFMERYAELIVRECATIASDFIYDWDGDQGIKKVILKEFGVEE